MQSSRRDRPFCRSPACRRPPFDHTRATSSSPRVRRSAFPQAGLAVAAALADAIDAFVDVRGCHVRQRAAQQRCQRRDERWGCRRTRSISWPGRAGACSCSNVHCRAASGPAEDVIVADFSYQLACACPWLRRVRAELFCGAPTSLRIAGSSGRTRRSTPSTLCSSRAARARCAACSAPGRVPPSPATRSAASRQAHRRAVGATAARPRSTSGRCAGSRGRSVRCAASSPC